MMWWISTRKALDDALSKMQGAREDLTRAADLLPMEGAGVEQLEVRKKAGQLGVAITRLEDAMLWANEAMAGPGEGAL